jgi:hypothetical protein
MKQARASKDTQERVQALEEHLRHLPQNLRFEDDAKEDPEHLLGKILLNIHIRNIISHLNRSPFLRLI